MPPALDATADAAPPSPAARAGQAERLALSLLALLVLAFAAWVLRPSQPVGTTSGAAVHHLTVAEVRFDDQDTAAPQVSVTLPDTWGARGLPTTGRAHYRVRFTLDAPPAELWALRAGAMSAHHEVRLNGALISGQALTLPTPAATAATSSTVRRSLPGAQRIALPPALLRAGSNQLDLHLSYGSLGGLSSLEVGPAAVLDPAHAVDRFRRHTLPVTLNVAALLVSLSMLVLRWRYRNEVLVGVVGLLATVGSLRNLLEFTVQDLPKAAATDWCYLGLQLLGQVLVAVGANAVAHGALRRSTRATALLAAAVWLAAGAAIPLGAFREMRALSLGLVFPMAIGLLLAALPHVEWSVRRTRPAVWAALATCLVAGLHDYLLRFGQIAMDHPDWLPLGVPLGLGMAAWALLNRTSRALRRARDMNTELEHRVTQRTRELQQANTAKSRFLAAASHDLRQPVVTIGLLVGLLRDQLDDARLRAMIGRVDEAVAAMEDLLKGLLDLSRLEAGTITPRRERVAVQRLFDAIASHEGEAARRKGLRLRFHPTALAVLSDPVLLEQILRNLVSNALRYTERGGVLVGCRRRGDGVWIQVRDTGRGIPGERQSEIFEEFVQLEPPGRERSRGLGLGLAIVSRSARLLGHPLRLHSVPGRGSCFTIELPATAAARQPDRVHPLSEWPLRGLRVALIEDEPGVRQALADRLNHWGGQVSAFEGQAALQAHARRQTGRWTDLIVSDQRLPDGVGMDVIAWIRAHQGATPAVLVTGDTDPEDLTRLNEQPVPVLHKPFRAEALLKCIRQALTQD